MRSDQNVTTSRRTCSTARRPGSSRHRPPPGRPCGLDGEIHAGLDRILGQELAGGCRHVLLGREELGLHRIADRRHVAAHVAPTMRRQSGHPVERPPRRATAEPGRPPVRLVALRQVPDARVQRHVDRHCRIPIAEPDDPAHRVGQIGARFVTVAYMQYQRARERSPRHPHPPLILSILFMS